MANRYCNIDGNIKIKDNYSDINIGFDAVEVDIDTNKADIVNLNTRVNTILSTPVEGVSAQEIIDARKEFPVLGDRLDDTDLRISTVEEELVNMGDISGELEPIQTELTNLQTTVGELEISINSVKTDLESMNYSTPIETYSNIINSQGVGIIGSEYYGNTATNIIKNGNFVNTDGWIGLASTLTASNNILNAKGTGTNAAPAINHLTQTTSESNKKFFGRALIKVPSGCMKAELYTYNGVSAKYMHTLDNPISGQWIELKGVTTQTEVGTQSITLYVKTHYTDAVTAKDKVMEVKEVLAIDMGKDTANPLYNLSADQMNTMFSNWFDGTKSGLASLRLRSTGKNLFDVSIVKTKPILQDIYSAVELERLPSKNVFGRAYLKNALPSGTTIYFSKTVNPNLTTSSERILLVSVSNLQGGSFITDGSVLKYVTVYHADNAIEQQVLRNLDYYLDIQLEQGTESTTYEPYKQSTSYIVAKDENNKIVNLSSLPNGVKDEIVGDGVVKKTGHMVLNGSLSWIGLTTVGETQRMSIDIDISAITQTSNTGYGYSIDGSYPVVNTASGGTRSIHILNSPRRVYVAIETSKINSMTGATTEEKFKAYLNQYPITFIYQLAEPKIYSIDTTPTQTFENGTVFIDTYLKEEFNATTTTITLPYPIISIESIERVANGVMFPTTGTLSSDGKTVTVTATGRYRIMGAIRTSEYLEPQKKLTFPLNLKSQVDSLFNGVSTVSKSLVNLQDKVDILLILNS